MSLSKVSTSVSNLAQFIKEKTVSNLLESSRTGELEIEEETLKRVNRIVDLSVSQAFSLAYGDVEKALVEYKNESK